MAPRPKRILIVERDDSVAEMLRALLLDEGYEVPARLAMLEDASSVPPNQPDLLLLDIDSVRGAISTTLDTLEVHPGTCNLPVVCMSTLVPPADLRSRRNVAGLVQKPFDLDCLMETVQRAI